jgi:guanine deaminase
MTKPVNHEEIMSLAIQKARHTMALNIGGPFGAAIVDPSGAILTVASNSVLKDHDPTAHAEMNAIRLAAKAKGTHDLTGCTLYTTSFPCPMCLSAILWANIKTVIYGCTARDAAEIGFRDDHMYDFIKGNLKDKSILELIQSEHDSCLTLFREYHEDNKEMY